MPFSKIKNVRVIIPTYNAEPFLNDLLPALARQSIAPECITVVDSSSSDRTAALCEDFGAEVIVIEQSEFNHGGTRRRMFTINLEERYAEADLDTLRDVMAKETRFWIESAYGEAMVRTASPSRMKHLEQRIANDDHLAELSRKARLEMSEPSRG